MLLGRVECGETKLLAGLRGGSILFTPGTGLVVAVTSIGAGEADIRMIVDPFLSDDLLGLRGLSSSLDLVIRRGFVRYLNVWTSRTYLLEGVLGPEVALQPLGSFQLPSLILLFQVQWPGRQRVTPNVHLRKRRRSPNSCVPQPPVT